MSEVLENNMEEEVVRKKISFREYSKLAEEKNINIIIESLKNGKSPLLRSWIATNSYADLAMNPKAQTVYKGVNVLMLDTKSIMNNFKSNSWLTFNQVKELGGHVNKGSSQVNVFFLHKGKSDEEINEIQKNKKLDPKEIQALKSSIFKCYGVFNIDDIDFKDKKLPEYKPELKPKNFDMKDFDSIGEKFAVKGESVQSKLLREQIAKYIIAKDFQINYEIDDAKIELLKKCPDVLSSNEILKILKDASKLSFSVIGHKQTQTINKNPLNEVFDKLKQTMRNKGKGYFNKEIWQKLFNLETEAKKSKSLDAVELKLKEFKQELDDYQSQSTYINHSNNNSNANDTTSDKEKSQVSMQYFRDNKKIYVPKNNVEQENVRVVNRQW